MGSICASFAATIFVFSNSMCWVGPPTWVALLQAQCAATIFSNCAPGRGTATPGWDGYPPLERFETKLLEFTPDVTIIDLVTNDHAAGLTPEQSASNLAQYVEASRAAGAEPLLMLPWPINDGFSTDNRGFGIGATRGAIQALAAGMGVRTLDPLEVFDYRTFRVQCTDPDGPGGSAPDGVHPHALACRQAIADYIAPRLP